MSGSVLTSLRDEVECRVRVDWVRVRVRWGMYDVRLCVAAKVRMIPIPILYCAILFLFL